MLIYYPDECNSNNAFSVFITEGGNNPKVTSHSAIRINVPYSNLDNNKPYY